MTFWQAFKATYSGSIAFLIACPLLALVPVVFELLQHAVEVHIGMYDSIAMAKATEHHPLRMGFGLVKIVALMVPYYWITRFLAYRDARFAGRFDARAIRLFAGILAFNIALAVIQLFVLPQSVPVLLASFFVGQVIGCLIAAWAVAAPLGNAAVGPPVSARIMARHMPWAIPFYLLAMLPLLVPHNVLGALAILGPRPLLWPILITDSLLVGWLSAVLVASGYYVAIRAAAKSGTNLIPERAVAGTPSDGFSHSGADELVILELRPERGLEQFAGRGVRE